MIFIKFLNSQKIKGINLYHTPYFSTIKLNHQCGTVALSVIAPP
ncbi:hypothetical protein [Moraxella lacunata]